MGKLVVMGGGAADAMAVLVRPIFELCSAAKPRVTIIPTAAGTAAGERESFAIWEGLFAGLGAEVQPLYLLDESPDLDQCAAAILASDAVFAPGGQARLLLRTWRKLGLDRVLRRAYRQGVVLAGRSAGANCWCAHSLGAEPHGRRARYFSYRRNRGLGLLNTTLCCHYEARREGFRVLLDTFGGTGIGLESGAALVVDGDRAYSVGVDGAQAYLVSTERVFLSETPIGGEPRPLKELGL